MEGERLTKKGKAMQAESGEIVLVNDKRVAYAVNEIVMIIWDLFDNSTIEEVVEKVADITKKEPAEIREPIKKLAAQLIEAELLGPT
ncbi:MAG: hypothetical protein C4339_04535 [Nitrososphaerota archaeon]